jgi:IMP dehydrogenase
MPSSIDKDTFFEQRAERGEALTFADVSLRFKASSVIDREVDTTTCFSRNVELKVPYVSAAMDTVTGPRMAIAMARLGGLGMLHAAMDKNEQRKAVRRVKTAQSGLIEEPVAYHQDTPLRQILADRTDGKYDSDFWSYLVYDNNQKLTGMLNQADFEFAEDISVPISSAMKPLSELLVAPVGTSRDEAYKRMVEGKKTKLPLVNNDGTIGGLYTFSDLKRLIRRNPENYAMDDKGRLRVAAAISTKDEPMERIEAMLRYGLDVVVFDSSIGDHELFMVPYIREAKISFPGLDIVVGNISDDESVPLLIDAGADGLQVGQGPGAICSTRDARVMREYTAQQGVDPVPIGSDGGIVLRGDVSKAIAAGADYVVMGNFLAGTDETPVPVHRREDGSAYVEYRGMGSEAAMRDRTGNRDRYSNDGSIPPPQGVKAEVPYKGSVNTVIRDLDIQVRKSLAACDATNIEQHQQNTRVYQQTAAGQRESHPHDVRIAGSN